MKKNSRIDRAEILKLAIEEIQRLKKKVNDYPNANTEPIAIIGMACRFPKGASTPGKFWASLKNQEDLVGPIPEKRLAFIPVDTWKKNPYLQEGGYLKEDIAAFDHRLFRFSPREAERTDPQQRLFLKVCWEALENAGYPPDGLRGSKTGIYAGIMLMEYMQQLAAYRKISHDFDPYDISGNGFSFLSGRAAYAFGFQGPAITTDTACSSSLVSIDRACKGLWMDECSMALAGGVNLLLSPESTLLFSSLDILSKDCRCKSFDAAANGTVRGEGCGVVVLKKLSHALRDKDPIHALIKATGVNQSGLAAGPTVPHGPAQALLLKEVWSKAGIADIGPDYIEAHGTGTEIGDPIELNTLIQLLPKHRKNKVFVGTVKTNMGHLEAAAGVAGFIKATLALKHKIIPGNLHFNTPSPHVNWDQSCIEVPQHTLAWQASSTAGMRTAAISSFGLSGTNAHIVLEEYSTEMPAALEKHMDENRKWPFRFSARNTAALQQQWIAFASFVQTYPNVQMDALSFSHNSSRADFKEKTVIWAKDSHELLIILNAAIADKTAVHPIKGLWRNSGDLPQEMRNTAHKETGHFMETQQNTALEQHVFAGWIEGEKIDWKAYYKGSNLRKIDVPNYQFSDKIFDFISG